MLFSLLFCIKSWFPYCWIGLWSAGKREGPANIRNSHYNYEGYFSKGMPIGTGKMSFQGCQQRGEYVMTDVFIRNNGMLETKQEPIWRCTTLEYLGAKSNAQ